MYSLVRKILFMLDPETAHDVSFWGMSLAHQIGLSALYGGRSEIPSRPVSLMGLDFTNSVGLAAGLDKNGQYIDALGSLGFGFIEVGTVTPRAQPGNIRPRLFRCPEQGAIINRMGFNNEGVDNLVQNVSRSGYAGVIGINIGKNLDTPVEQAASDYLACFQRVYPVADYVTANLSSPNTPGLRNLQQGDTLRELVGELINAREQLQVTHGKYVPLLIKIAPDMTEEDAGEIVDILVNAGVDGLIATNTTIDKSSIPLPLKEEAGGLSGQPLFRRSTRMLEHLSSQVDGRLCLVGVGGIDSESTAVDKFDAGADLIQLYTGLIYQGPALARRIVESLPEG
jgi:dihydroorotate dehydrogenase